MIRIEIIEWLRAFCAAEGVGPFLDESSVPMNKRRPVAPELLGQEHNFLITSWSTGARLMPLPLLIIPL